MMDPLLPHLLDIMSSPASSGLILAGGFGIRLKQSHLRDTNTRTLIAPFPEARATLDLDFFLSLSLFVQKERGAAVRQLLDQLGYTEYTPKYQFGKPMNAASLEYKIKIDLLARLPEGEDIQVRTLRVGANSGTDLHGRQTPEGFAVEENPQQIPLRGDNSNGVMVETTVLLPNPYAWLNLKVKAAYDWLRAEQGEIPPKPGRAKHVFDVYVLIAMLTELELQEASGAATRHENRPLANEIRDCARILYADRNGVGMDEIRRQSNTTIEYETFWQALSLALGL